MTDKAPGYVIDERSSILAVTEWWWSLGAWDSKTTLDWHGPYKDRNSAEKDAQAAVKKASA